MKCKFPLSGIGITAVGIAFITMFLMGFSNPSQAKPEQAEIEFSDTATIVYPGYADEPIEITYPDERPIAINDAKQMDDGEMSDCDLTESIETDEETEETIDPDIIVCDIVPDQSVIPYTEDDLDLLARLLTAEVGSSWIPDEIQLYVGSVVLNRMANEYFPDTLYDVIYQPGQYSPTWNGRIDNTPDERTIENARKLLEEGSVLPANVVFQANFKQGEGVYHEYYDEILETTTYFCYISD